MQRIPKLLAFGLLLLTTSCSLIPDSVAKLLVPVITPSSCDQPLRAEIRMVAPHWGPPRQEMDVVWEVIAFGCTGLYKLPQHAHVKPFTSFAHFFRFYDAIKLVKETVTVQSIDKAGNVMDETTVSADPFTISALGPRFLSPPAEARAESVRPRDDGLGCRLEKEGKIGPKDTIVNYRLTVDGEHEGANVNGFGVKNGQLIPVPANENQVFRAIGVVFGKQGHAVCQSYFVAPRCQISLLENSYDLVRKKVTTLGKIDRVVLDGTTRALSKDSETLTLDEIPNRFGKTETAARVYGPEGDEGYCAASYVIPDPQLKIKPLRAIASSTWKDASPRLAIDGQTQQGWIAETRGKGWIRVDLGRNYRLSRIRLCVDQSKPGMSNHEVYIGADDHKLRKVASFKEMTTAGQWLEKNLDEKEIRFVEVKTLDSNSQVSWREIEIYQCTTFRDCGSAENGTLN